MGYTTEFSGNLTFVNDPTAKQLAKLKTFMGEDCRDHPEWNSDDMTWINLQITDDYSGIEWDGSEKTYELPKKINMITKEMRKEYPDFELQGQLEAIGESFGDNWLLVMRDGVAYEESILLTGTKVTCPHCEEEFMLKDADTEKL